MLRDLKFFRRNNENVPTDPSDSSAHQLDADPSRAPLHSIQDPVQNPRTGAEEDAILRRKMERTPSKNQTRNLDTHPPFRTPEKLVAARSRFGWVPRAEQRMGGSDNGDEPGQQGTGQLSSLSRGIGNGHGISGTPRAYRTGGKASSVHSDSSSTQSTPTKSVTKPSFSNFSNSRPPMGVGLRMANFSGPSKGMPISSVPQSVVNTVEVPHFELKEDQSFWMDHNVQVVIRVRPLNSTERNLQGYNRCLKQENMQSIVWIGQPETRFTFDHVACETVTQEMLFRVAGLPMVENCLSGYNSCMFAYGQTGSGKTYTMLGEVDELEIRPSPQRGMTPRIFEFLFARIRAEEESRRDENLKYNCKCSFLEIYNEQITDLLDPSCNNLLLREDQNKSVYVENLSEFEVESVNDIIKLLLQGGANRKVAATNMNRESSRSHSVFTCVIESRWVKDSTSNLRFARLNLVDLAGSERQKTSGAEGERLKEAANINKSLSTLGHVIMILADMANGKQRHVPYRDSRLTFLLQDSLGGNSKTMIIANVSPSICCANETLSTLKFAQRAKLIQNNAIVNEDASGDVNALQNQIRLLKEELSVLKRQNVSRSLSFRTTIFDDPDSTGGSACRMGKMPEVPSGSADELHDTEALPGLRVSAKQLNSLQAILTGALRREKMADITVKQLEAEIEQLNRLVRQREDDTQSTKMMLKFREDKIQRMESMVDGLMPPESYLLEENKSLSEEIKLLRLRVDRNPEVTRFALENIRLLDQLRRAQEFYEEGERDFLLTEVAELRNQLMQVLGGNFKNGQRINSDAEPEDDGKSAPSSSVSDNYLLHAELEKTVHELEDCRNNLKSCLEVNANLTREINGLHAELSNMKSAINDQKVDAEPQNGDCCSKTPRTVHPNESKKEDFMSGKKLMHAEEILNLQLELDILKEILKEEKLSLFEEEKRATALSNELTVATEKILLISKHYEDMKTEVEDARSIIEALESQHVVSINELEELRETNDHNVELLKKQEHEITAMRRKLGVNLDGQMKEQEEVNDHPSKHSENEDSPLLVKLKKMQASLEKSRMLNTTYQNDQASQTSHKLEMEDVCRQVEAETAEVIVCLQDELMTLQQKVDDSHRNELVAKETKQKLQAEITELNENINLLTRNNEKLGELVDEKDRELNVMSEDWDRLAYEIAEVLADGNLALEEAASQVGTINDSFTPRSWIGTKFERVIKSISDRDMVIEELQKSLDDAQNLRSDLEWKLRSLRGATQAITEAQQQENSDKENEINVLTAQLSENLSVISELEKSVELQQGQIRKSEICATVAFLTVDRLSEKNRAYLQELEHLKFILKGSTEKQLLRDTLLQDHEHVGKQIHPLKLEIEQSQEDNDYPPQARGQEQEQSQSIESEMEIEGEYTASEGIVDDLKKARIQINEFKVGVNTLHSCISEYVDVKGAAGVCDIGSNSDERKDTNSEDRINDAYTHYALYNSQCSAQGIIGSGIKRSPGEQFGNCELRRLSEDNYESESTITLLRNELESALGSLKQVQNQMAELCHERDKNEESEIQNQKEIETVLSEVYRLKSEMIDKEQQFEMRLQELQLKLQKVEADARVTNEEWHKAKEVLELETFDAKTLAAQKTTEASSLLAKFEEAQETMRDAELMVNTLVKAKESAQVEIQRLHKIEMSLHSERNGLVSKVDELQRSLNVKEEEYEHILTKFQQSVVDARGFVLALEDIIRHMQAAFTEKLQLMTFDLESHKSQLHDYTELARIWLEETWSEIIGRDCAVSVLHLCHMGILLERMTGLNAENSFLYHGLCASNSIVTNLRDHNDRAKKELEMCSILKGKLLVDINRSFNRIKAKEVETVELRAKLVSFEKKIIYLQLQEESMLARSNSMCTELANLMNEVDANNRNALSAVSYQDRILREKEELQKQLEEKSFLLDEAEGICEILNGSVCCDLVLVANKSRLDDQKTSETGLEKEPEIPKDLIECRTESILLIVLAKELELLVLMSELKHKARESNQMASQIAELERQKHTSVQTVEKIKEKMILQIIGGELKSSEIDSLSIEKEKLSSDVLQLKYDNARIAENLQISKTAVLSSLGQVNLTEQENHELRERACSLEACIVSLRTNLDSTHSELEDIKSSNLMLSKELDRKAQALEILEEKANTLELENGSLQNEVGYRRGKDESVATLHNKLESFFLLHHSVAFVAEHIFNILDGVNVHLTDRLYQEICEHRETASKLVSDLETLESSVTELIKENLSQQSELMCKDEVLKGLLFDLSLLQESTSIAKDQKHELQDMAAGLESLEHELVSTSCKLDEALNHEQKLEVLLLEKQEKISALELDLSETQDSLNLISSENIKLKVHVQDITRMKNVIEEELSENSRATERLEEELLEITALLDQRTNVLKDIKNDMTNLADERDHLNSEVLVLKERLEMSQALAEENEAIAMEVREIAEEKKAYAEEKEEEVKLLERSIEELECTINALENKVEMVKAEAEKQRLQREELEVELQAVRHQMLTGTASIGAWNIMEDEKIDLSRLLKDKAAELEESEKSIQSLQKESSDKDAEIMQCKAYISELHMHAEAQAREYKQKFRELESMAQEVKAETTSSSAASVASTKSDKTAAKSRGTGSPFKCIGLGLTQQINSEKDEELTLARRQIEELEALLAKRQKEIFMLNTRLAAAESMTHDVIRDLLGVKLDMTNYASLLDDQKGQNIKETAWYDGQESHHKEQEVVKLKKLLNEFIEERQSWLDEINQRQAEMVATHIALEKLQQRDQFIATENEALKADNAKQKKMVVELENEIKKLSNQQNLQQRIHHHAKIKEENSSLKSQKEDLNTKLHRSEVVLSRVKEELAHYRTSSGRSPCINFDKEEELNTKLEESEEERIRLAQKLLTLCTSILKVAGFAHPQSNVDPVVAEDALDQISHRITSLNTEVHDLKLKCKIYCEKIRLFEIGRQSSPLCSRTRDNCLSPSIS